MLQIDDLSYIRLDEARRDAQCNRLLDSINVLVMIDLIRSRCDIRWTLNVFWSWLQWSLFKVVRLRLAVLIIIVRTVVVAVRGCTGRTLLLISDYRFIDHCYASVAAADGH